MAEKIHQFKIKIATAKRKITNFGHFVDKYNPNRDFYILEIRKKDNDRNFTEFETLQAEFKVLKDDPTHPAIRTEYEDRSEFKIYFEGL